MTSIEYIYSTTLLSDTATLLITNIPQTYNDLILSFEGMSSYTSDNGARGLVYFNTDSSSTNYSDTHIHSNPSSSVSSFDANQNRLPLGKIASVFGGNTLFGSGEMHIFNYTNTNMYKTTLGTSFNVTNSMNLRYEVGLWRSTSAISGIGITADGSWKAGSSFTLWGVK